MNKDTSLDDLYKEMESRTKYSSDFYKLAEGANTMRILTSFNRVKTLNKGQKYQGIFTGDEAEEKKLMEEHTLGPDGKKKYTYQIGMKGWAWAAIKNGEFAGELKIVQLGKTILGQLVALKNSADYGFDDYPMPYDLTINAKGAGTKEVEYTTVGARQNTEVAPEEMDALNKKKPIVEILKMIIDKQEGKKEVGKGYEYPEESINPDDIKF